MKNKLMLGEGNCTDQWSIGQWSLGKIFLQRCYFFVFFSFRIKAIERFKLDDNGALRDDDFVVVEDFVDEGWVSTDVESLQQYRQIITKLNEEIER